MNTVNKSVSPFWVRIELNPPVLLSGGASAPAPLTANTVRAYAVLTGSPLEALLAGMEQFLNVFSSVEPGQLTYRVHTLGPLGFPEGPDYLPVGDKEIAEQKILHRSTSPRLPLKNFTAFLSFVGLPEMFSQVIQVRTMTHAASALRHAMQRLPLQIVDSDVVASLFEGDHSPEACTGREVLQLPDVRYSEFQHIKVLDDRPNSAEKGFTIVEHGGSPSTRYVESLEPNQLNELKKDVAIVALKGKQVDLISEFESVLFYWEVKGRYETHCTELPDAREA
jgi:hypothetical protein